jgi:methylthioribose-1-phosphate isomerase
VAELAATAPKRPGRPAPQVVVTAVAATITSETSDGAAIPVEIRGAQDFVAYLADVPIRADGVLVPATDVIPAGRIGALVTEHGLASPVTAEDVARVSAADTPGDPA